MNQIKTLLLATLLVAAAGEVHAQRIARSGGIVSERFQAAGSYKVLNAVALTATRTATLETGRSYSKLIATADFTRSAATVVTATFTCDLGGGVYGSLTASDIGTTSIFTRAVTNTLCDADAATAAPTCATFSLNLEYDVRGCENSRLAFASTAGDTGDLLTLYATAVAGQ